MVIALVVVELFLSVLNVSFAKKVTEMGYLEHLSRIRRFILPLVIMGLVATAGTYVVSTIDAVMPQIGMMAIVIVTSVFTYMGGVYYIWRWAECPEGAEKSFIDYVASKFPSKHFCGRP